MNVLVLMYADDDETPDEVAYDRSAIYSWQKHSMYGGEVMDCTREYAEQVKKELAQYRDVRLDWATDSNESDQRA